MATHNLEHLRTFLTVYRVGSLTEAARLLGISQPTASTHVHSLEQNLGCGCLSESPSGVTPTPKAEGLAGMSAHTSTHWTTSPTSPRCPAPTSPSTWAAPPSS